RIHIPYILEPDAEIARKGADTKLGIEVSINGLMFGAGSAHHNGGFYGQLGKAGIVKIKILNKTQALILLNHMTSMCQGHGAKYFTADGEYDEQEKAKFSHGYTAHLHDDSTRIKKGERHEVLKFICCSSVKKYAGDWHALPDDQRFGRVLGYDKK